MATSTAALRRVARALLFDRHLAEDAVQEAWLACLQRPRAVPLVAVARGKAVDLQRTESRRRVRERAAAQPESQPSALESVARIELMRRVVDAVEALAEPYRATILLRFFDGLPPRAIARRLDVPVETVRTHVRRGLSRLRRRLDPGESERGAFVALLLQVSGGAGLSGITVLTTWWIAVLMKSTSLKLLAAALLLALLSLFGIEWSSPSSPDELAYSDRVSRKVTAVGDRASADASVARGRERGVAAGAASSDDPPNLEPPLTRGVAVRVVRGRTDEPVPNAIVYCADEDPVDERALIGREVAGVDLVDDLMRFGRAFRADEDGVVVVPPPDQQLGGYLVVASRHRGSFGALSFRYWRAGCELELRLFPDRPLKVRVVDADRRPAARARVRVRHTWPSGESRLLAQKTTDAEGLAVFRGVRQFGRDYRADHELAVELAGLWREPRAVRFDPEDPPTEVVELVRPASSELEVVVTDRDARPVEFPVVVRAWLADAPERAVSAVTASGRVRFAQVEPNLRVRVEPRRFDHDRAEATAATTARAGERRSVAVRLAAARPVLAGRLFRPGGERLASRTVEVELRGQRSVVRSDADGRIRVPLRVDLDTEEAFAVEIVAVDDEATYESVRVCHGPLPNGIDLGDVRLDLSPVLVAGRVVDSTGRGVEGAEVRVHAYDRPTGRYTGQLRRAITGTLGEFVAHGHGPSPTIRVDARHAFAPRESAEVEPGATGVVIRLKDGGRIEGSVRFSADWQCATVGVFARLDTDTEWRKENSLVPPGFIRLEGLLPGSYLVRISADQGNHGIDFPGVIVRPGEITRDPRLREVDLRGKLRVLSFPVVSPSGEPVEGGEVHLRTPGSSGWDEHWFHELNRGRAELVTLRDQLDVYVRADGYRGRYLPSVRDGQRVVLTPGIGVRVFWPQAAPRLRDGLRLRVALVLRDAVYPALWCWPRIGAGGAGDVTVLPTGGRYEVRYSVQAAPAGRWVPLREATATVDVLDQAEPQDVVLELPHELSDSLRK